MKVVLPDGKELELEDGATGLDAARAIGPRLAEQAVLVRSNGSVQDLRLPLRDGQPVQFLTTRDVDDPDALYVLRHSSAHLLAEAVRRLYPGVRIAIGPPIENGFYYDFEFPEPIGEADLERIEDEVRRELAEGRSWSREIVTGEEARQRFAAQGEPYKVELVDTAEGDISLYTQSHDGVGDFTDLCRGPHLQDSSPIRAFKLTNLAGALGTAGDTVGAAQTLDAALQLANNLGDRVDVARIEYNLGRIAIAAGRREEAELRLNSALLLANLVSWREGIAAATAALESLRAQRSQASRN